LPGACSPSRSVVSKTDIRRGAACSFTSPPKAWDALGLLSRTATDPCERAASRHPLMEERRASHRTLGITPAPLVERDSTKDHGPPPASSQGRYPRRAWSPESRAVDPGGPAPATQGRCGHDDSSEDVCRTGTDVPAGERGGVPPAGRGVRGTGEGRGGLHLTFSLTCASWPTRRSRRAAWSSRTHTPAPDTPRAGPAAPGRMGHGPIPWNQQANCGFLRCLATLARATETIGERDETEGCGAGRVDRGRVKRPGSGSVRMLWLAKRVLRWSCAGPWRTRIRPEHCAARNNRRQHVPPADPSTSVPRSATECAHSRDQRRGPSRT
jgi:hypothetical protein